MHSFHEKKRSQQGGILLIFLIMVPILLLFLGGILSVLYTNALQKRVVHAAHLFRKHPQEALKIMPQIEKWGVSSSSLEDDQENHVIRATLSVKPFLIAKINEVNFTYEVKYAKNPLKVVALIDVFFPEHMIEQFSDLTPFLGMLKTLGEMDNIDLTIVPFAGSIHIPEPISFVPMPEKKKQIVRKLADFEKLSPYKAILKNKTGDLILGDVPDASLWKGCIACRSFHNTWTQEKELGFLPYFWPSTFGKRYLDDKRDMKQFLHPSLGSIAITGSNNWTVRTIREAQHDYLKYGGFVMGPNIGCPAPISKAKEFEPESLYPVTRGGSMLPLAFDYALDLLKDNKERKLILLFKATPLLTYKYEGPQGNFQALVTQESGFPIGDGALDYNAYGSVTDLALLEKLKEQIKTFQSPRQKMIIFSFDENSYGLVPYLGMENMFISLGNGKVNSEEILKTLRIKIKQSEEK